MRKTLVIVIAVVALFAVGAFAANLAVDGGDVASGGVDTDLTCTTGVDIDYQLGAYDSTQNDWEVTGVVLTFDDGGCDGETGEVALEGTGGTLVTIGTFTVNGASTTPTPVTLTGPDTVWANAADTVAVLVGGSVI